MLFHDLQERAALQDLAERGSKKNVEALESFLLSHYAAPHPHADYLMQIVKNMVAITGDYYFSLPREKRLSFLTCMANVFKTVFAMKIWESRLSAVDAVKQQSGKPLFFAPLTELIGPLEAIQKGLQEIDAELPFRRVMLVEGETEEAFIRSIQLHSTVLNFDFAVYIYEGKGSLKNLVHYVAEKNTQGIRVDLSVDYDGRSQSKSFIEKLTQSCARSRAFLGLGVISRSPFRPKYYTRAFRNTCVFIPSWVPRRSQRISDVRTRMFASDRFLRGKN
jgi:hypothetical protein